ncbi:MAG: hypothetical protein SGBAC_002015 [Bacillariaceae sp.]
MATQYGAIPIATGGGDTTTTTQAFRVRRKEGSVFLGCCDMRRAVIILDTINLVLLVIQMMLYITVMRAEEEEEPQTRNDIEMEVAAQTMLRISAVEALLCIISLFGALSFSTGMVVAGIVNFGVGVAAGFVLMNWPGIIINLVFLAPHVLLFMEIQRGIMTEANYYQEEHSCCCV